MPGEEIFSENASSAFRKLSPAIGLTVLGASERVAYPPADVNSDLSFLDHPLSISVLRMPSWHKLWLGFVAGSAPGPQLTHGVVSPGVKPTSIVNREAVVLAAGNINGPGSSGKTVTPASMHVGAVIDAVALAVASEPELTLAVVAHGVHLTFAV